MLALAVHGRCVQWCNAVALLLKGFERVGKEPLMTASLGLQLLTVPHVLPGSQDGQVVSSPLPVWFEVCQGACFMH